MSAIPILNIAIDLLKIVDRHNGLKLTPKGNLQTKIVQELYNKKYITDEFIENGISKLNSEEKWDVLHTVKLVLKLSKLLRVRKGKLVIPAMTEDKLLKDQRSEIFSSFFQAFTTQFNWAYNDGIANEEVGQIGFLYLLHLVKKYGGDYRDIKYYVTLYFRAFPMLQSTEEDDEDASLFNESEFGLKIRFFGRFAFWFGLIESKNKNQKIYLEKNFKIKKTEILSNLLHQS